MAQVQAHVAQWFQQVAYASSDTTLVDEIISRAYRLYMAPPILPGERKAHTWSWIRPETTKSVATDPTGTFTTKAAEDTALIDSAATFLTAPLSTTLAVSELIGRTVSAVSSASSTTYTNTIASVTNGTTLVLDNAWSAAFAAEATTSDTYTIFQDGDWNLPDDHGGIVGNLTFDTTTSFPPVVKTSEFRIRDLRQNNFMDQTRRPSLYALRPRLFAPVASSADVATTRWEIMLWPRPDATYTFHYRYVKMFADITEANTTFNFPGGLRNAEVIMAAALAVAEKYAQPSATNSGGQWDYFMTVLASAVSFDRSEMMAENLGPNLDRSDRVFDHHIHHGENAVTYLGVQYPT